MVKITEELVRKKSEHNEGEISTLEELSLHQENIDKIEHLQHWCRNLQILLLQSNLISRIENLHKLKQLQYLNLALNNIELIENLERCESLEKLDLTLNFISNIESVCSLANNIHLKDFYLTGNPCTEFTGYRNYVIAKLPQIQSLDCKEITRSERLKALQLITTIEKDILIDQEFSIQQRNEQKVRLTKLDNENISDEQFWSQKSEHCPEVRIEMANRQIRARNNDENDKKPETKPCILFNKDGKPFNMNQSKIKFKVDFENPDEITVDLSIYKYLDTNLINVDIQPTYVRVCIKKKIFQLVLPEEIVTNKSVAERSQSSGHLVLRMPKLNPKKCNKNAENDKVLYPNPSNFERQQRREFLEIGPDRLTQICNLVEKEFIDDDSVPPLE